MAIEFEIEAELTDRKILEPFLSTMQFVEEKEQIDIYYDTADYVLYKNAVFVRNRNHKVVDIKGAIDEKDLSHLACEELRFKLPFEATDDTVFASYMQKIIPIKDHNKLGLEKFELTEFVTIKKHRQKYANNDYELVIDEVDGLGDYFEIEVKNGNPDELLRLVDEYKIERLPLGYVELYLRKHNFDLYMQGCFLLDEDRKIKR